VSSAFYLVRHAETNWTLVNARQLVGAANDLAPLTELGVRQIEALTDRLRTLALCFILTSPMTRALQTAAVLSRALDLPLHVELDLHEWVPDLTYSWRSPEQVVALVEDMRRWGGEWPSDGPHPLWEQVSSVRERSLNVLRGYAQTEGPGAVVTHGGVIESLTGREAALCDVVPFDVQSSAQPTRAPGAIVRRPATDADRAFAQRTHHLAYRDVVERQFGAWVDAQQDRFFALGWAAMPHEIVMSDGVPCGYVCVEDRATDVHVRELVLAPDYQGRGIGSAVLESVLQRARARRVPVRLATHHANRAANLYQRMGFRQIGSTDTHHLFEWSAAN
jgi:broad specificity phosphatase PhoE/L-amino acid N-acyltransferase YncA